MILELQPVNGCLRASEIAADVLTADRVSGEKFERKEAMVRGIFQQRTSLRLLFRHSVQPEGEVPGILI